MLTGVDDSDDRQIDCVTRLVRVMDPEALRSLTGSAKQSCTAMACSRGNSKLVWHYRDPELGI